MITATLATCKGREESLEQTVNSLKDQVDKICVYANYKKKPVPDGAEYHFGKDLADMGKFFFDVEGYHLVCDDDLTYPPRYAEVMTNSVDRFGVVSMHGGNIQSPCKSYYKDRVAFVHCLADFPVDMKVMIPGSGVMAYHTDLVKFKPVKKYMYMADIYVATVLQKKKISVTALAHPKGWIKHNDIDLYDTIWADYHENDARQTKAINEIKEWKILR